MTKPKVALGIVSYGGQDAAWWKALVNFVGMWDRDKVEYAGICHSGVSTTDINRNNVANEFLHHTNADWLMWIDADNPPPVGTVERLLEPKHKLISGLYYGGNITKEMQPIAYVVNPKGGYHSIKQMKDWNKGEILPVDAVGNGCFLNHRSVFEEIEANYEVFQRQSGGRLVIHKDKVKGVVPDNMAKHTYAQEVHKGILYDPIIQYDMSDKKYPFYMCQYGRTEDYTFCEYARELGHMIYVDTFVEVGHVKAYPFSGEDMRKQSGKTPSDKIEEVDYV